MAVTGNMVLDRLSEQDRARHEGKGTLRGNRCCLLHGVPGVCLLHWQAARQPRLADSDTCQCHGVACATDGSMPCSEYNTDHRCHRVRHCAVPAPGHVQGTKKLHAGLLRQTDNMFNRMKSLLQVK